MTLTSMTVTPGVPFHAPKNCGLDGGINYDVESYQEKGYVIPEALFLDSDDKDHLYVVLEVGQEYQTNLSGPLVPGSAVSVNGVRYGLVKLEEM